MVPLLEMGKRVPVTVSWANETKTCILYCVEGAWDWPALYAAVQRADGLLDTVAHTVHAIIHTHSDTELPIGFMWRFKTLRKTPHPRRGKTVIVSSNHLMHRMFKVFSQLNPDLEARLDFAHSLEEACTLLGQPVMDGSAGDPITGPAP